MEAKYAGKCPRCSANYPVGTSIYSDNKRWIPVDCQGCAKRKTDLNHLLGRGFLGPNSQGDSYAEITCVNKFEAPGCHDTWGFLWTLTLPNVQSHWWSTTGWRPRSPGIDMKVEGGSLEQVVHQASEFLQWWKEQQS